MAQVVVSERVVECRSDASSLWKLLTDTDRTNRAIGMARIELSPLENATAARYLVKTSLGGFDVEYEERPYEWVYLQHFKILRRMRSGPVEWIEMSQRLEPLDRGGTRVTMRLSLRPKVAILSPFLRVRASQSLRKIEKEIALLDAAIGSGAAPPRLRAAAAHDDALERATRLLEKSAAPDVARRLARHVREADDAAASRLRPFELADEWGIERRELLGACLSAVPAGLLELRWEVVCPSCRTASQTIPSLSDLGEHATCQLCDIDFGIDLDQAVEATFAPSRAVREIDAGPYCIGGPARTPHVVAQAILPARGQAVLVAPAEEGSYRLFVRGGSTTRVDVRAGAPTTLALDTAALPSPPSAPRESAPPTEPAPAPRASTPSTEPEPAPAAAPIEIAPGGSITVKHAAPEELHVKLERATWARKAATARDVTAMPGFRRQFSSDVLRPGMALKVSRVGLFFSDLTGSTALYSSAGDAAAFKLVQDHFEVLVGIVEKNGGALVKTMGDAVMAAFGDDLDGLVASLAILHAWGEFRAHDALRGTTHLKLGVFGGPCYVVTANGTLDYFGQTANIAARLQAEARSGEIVVEAALADHAIRAGVLHEKLVIERYAAALKGIERPFELARISMA